LAHPTVKRRLANPKSLCDFVGCQAMLSPFCEDSFVESVAMRAVNVRSAHGWQDACSSPALERQPRTFKQGRCFADCDIAFHKRLHLLTSILPVPLGSTSPSQQCKRQRAAGAPQSEALFVMPRWAMPRPTTHVPRC
jgi:hypothetical protein